MVALVVALGAATALAVGIVWVRHRFVAVRVTGTSMEPALRDGQRVLVRRAGVGAVRRGDLVVFALTAIRLEQRGDPPWMVKRAIALAGEPMPRGSVPPALGDAHARVPERQLVVQGDNPTRSFDSRQAGFVDGGALLGVVVRTLA